MNPRGGKYPPLPVRQCTCRAGQASDCTTTDCSVRHPGCVDKEGVMYREGDTFVPKGELY